MIADVAHIHRSQQCVTDSMDEHVRIRMPQQIPFHVPSECRLAKARVLPPTGGRQSRNLSCIILL